jgi:Tat protein translocase TatB subunit
MNIFSNIGTLELLVILILALLVVGPERLPDLVRGITKVLRDVRRAYDNLTRDLGPEIMSIQQTTREIRTSVESIKTIPQDLTASIVKVADMEEIIDEMKGIAQEIKDNTKAADMEEIIDELKGIAQEIKDDTGVQP